jgi:ribosomal-protein-alanine N-acetyltransferase
MSALPKCAPRFRPLTARDLETVEAIEREIYEFPWTRGNFHDSLAAGYSCWACQADGALAGYAVMMIGAGEAHLLNLSIAAPHQRRGFGRALLAHMMRTARDHGARVFLLEVRPSNLGARALYADCAFAQIGTRRGYYPARDGREDALLLSHPL